MNLSDVFQQLAIALGLGLLVGLQRESAASRLAGIRTFPLVTLLGALAGLLAPSFGGWTVGAGLLAMAAMIYLGKTIELKHDSPDPGLTTEVTILLMYTVGAYLMSGYTEVAVVVGGAAAVLLHFKGQMHGLVARLGDNDLKAVMQFALISLVILPVLPNQNYGPYGVLNPRQIWWLVVLIVGINLGGYIAYKFFGQRAGVVLGGVLGGLISSTATTVSYARRTSNTAESARLASIVIMIASTIVFARILLVVLLAARHFFAAVWMPLGVMFLLMAGLSAALWLRGHGEKDAMPEQENPTELRSALLFGLFFALILLAVAWAKEQFGSRGLYAVAAISGLTDVDAITLSTARLASDGQLDGASGWRIILVAALSNLLFKGATVAALGHSRLLGHIATLFAVAIAAGTLLLLFWPA